jgi:hypothetical protein
MKKFLTALAGSAAALAASASAAPSLFFLIDGNTFNRPYSLVNNSDNSEQITRLFIDLTASGNVFDTLVDDDPFINPAREFSLVDGTGVLTGLTSSSVVDGGTTLDLSFNDFDAGEAFNFAIDVDQAASGSARVLGNELIGSLIFVEFNNGERLSGVLSAVLGNADAAQFIATGTDPIPEIPVPAAGLLMAGALGLAGLRKKEKRA